MLGENGGQHNIGIMQAYRHRLEYFTVLGSALLGAA
jgi:hypothetical protein